MHKLSKGLKKKIKGKKSKEKEEELDHAELVKLRREAQEAAESAAAKAAANVDANANASDPAEGDSDATGHQPTASENKPESEEWLKFKLLTSGNYIYILNPSLILHRLLFRFQAVREIYSS